MRTQQIAITKTRRGWQFVTTHHEPGWKHPAITVGGESTLAWGLFMSAGRAADQNATITEITVKGQSYPLTKARDVIRKYELTRIGYMVPKALAALRKETK
jgi:hypothetical protein